METERREVKAVNTEAIGILWEKHRSYIFNFACKLTHNRDSAEDLIQEAFVKALLHFDQFRGRNDNSFHGWVNTIVLNLFRNEFRKVSRGKVVSFSEVKGISDFPSTPAVDNTSVFLDKVILLSKPHHGRLLDLVYRSDLDYREIAEELGIPHANVKLRLCRIHKDIRRRFLIETKKVT